MEDFTKQSIPLTNFVYTKKRKDFGFSREATTIGLNIFLATSEQQKHPKLDKLPLISES